MKAISIAAGGMTAAGAHFTVSARRLESGRADYVVQAVEAVSSKTAFRASLMVLKTTDDMLGRLLDIKV